METREIKTWEEDGYYGGGLPNGWLDGDDHFTRGLEPPYDETA